MASNKHQHFVPQFYLRYFAEQEGGSSVSIFNLKSRRHIPRASIAGQCARSYYYGRDETIETEIQRLERLGASMIRKILSTGILPPVDSEDSASLRLFLMFQRGRTPSAVEEYEAWTTEGARRFLKAHATFDPAAPPGVAELADQVHLRFDQPVLDTIKASIESHPVIFDLDHKLIVNGAPIEFVTSDVGVVFHNKWLESVPFTGPLGLARRGLLIFLPLGPRKQLILFDSWTYRVGPDGFDTVTIKDSKSVLMLNTLHYAGAEQNIYYSGHSATAESLNQIQVPRTPRGARISSIRAVSDDGKSELVQFLLKGLDVRLDLPWVKVTKHAERMDVHARGRANRPEAMRIANLISPRAPPRPPREGEATSWKVVPD